MASGSEKYSGINKGRKARKGTTKAGRRTLPRMSTPQGGSPF